MYGKEAYLCMEKRPTYVWKSGLLIYVKEAYLCMEKRPTYICKRGLLMYGKEAYLCMEKRSRVHLRVLALQNWGP
jgi:hypothetical protein